MFDLYGMRLLAALSAMQMAFYANERFARQSVFGFEIAGGVFTVAELSLYFIFPPVLFFYFFGRSQRLLDGDFLRFSLLLLLALSVCAVNLVFGEFSSTDARRSVRTMLLIAVFFYCFTVKLPIFNRPVAIGLFTLVFGLAFSHLTGHTVLPLSSLGFPLLFLASALATYLFVGLLEGIDGLQKKIDLVCLALLYFFIALNFTHKPAVLFFFVSMFVVVLRYGFWGSALVVAVAALTIFLQYDVFLERYLKTEIGDITGGRLELWRIYGENISAFFSVSTGNFSEAALPDSHNTLLALWKNNGFMIGSLIAFAAITIMLSAVLKTKNILASAYFVSFFVLECVGPLTESQVAVSIFISALCSSLYIAFEKKTKVVSKNVMT